MTKVVVWKREKLYLEYAQKICPMLVDLRMDFKVTYNPESETFDVDVFFALPDGSLGADPVPKPEWGATRREDGTIETTYPLEGGYTYDIELNSKMVEWGHSFKSAQDACGRHIGDVKIIARKWKSQ